MENTPSAATPLDQRFSLEAIIAGLANDLEAVRAGRMTIEAARAQAEIAKQLFNGVRLVINAQSFLEKRAKQIGQGDSAPRSPSPNDDDASD